MELFHTPPDRHGLVPYRPPLGLAFLPFPWPRAGGLVSRAAGESAEGHSPKGTIQESKGAVKEQRRRQCQGAVTTDRTDSTVEGWEFLPHPPRPYWSGFQADGRSCPPSFLPNVAANVAILGVGRLEGGGAPQIVAAAAAEWL
jgi:hypothetical protein